MGEKTRVSRRAIYLIDEAQLAGHAAFSPPFSND